LGEAWLILTAAGALIAEKNGRNRKGKWSVGRDGNWIVELGLERRVDQAQFLKQTYVGFNSYAASGSKFGRITF
jgi:hypothetical protein